MTAVLGTVTLAPIDTTFWATCWFTLALLLLDLIDSRTTGAEPVTFGAALAAASVVVLGPARALLVCLSVAFCAAVIAQTRSVRSCIFALFRRGLGVTLAALPLLMLSQLDGVAWRYLGVALVPALLLVSEIVVSEVTHHLGKPYVVRLARNSVRSQIPLLAAQWSTSLMLLFTYQGMGPWSLVPVVVLLLLMRQSHLLLTNIRETYLATVKVLAEAAESQDERRVGHADRVAQIAYTIGLSVGMSAAQLEAVEYAALLHDIDIIGAEKEDAVLAADATLRIGSAEMIREVGFFSAVLPILELCEGKPSALTSATAEQKNCALVLALADHIDAKNNSDIAMAHEENRLSAIAEGVMPVARARIIGATRGLGFEMPVVV